MASVEDAQRRAMTRTRFDAYVERCLYDPEHGFYRSGAGRAGGHRGDFLTSPEVGPLFATVLGRAIDQWWLELGQPDPFVVYDIGTGPGTLARQLSSVPGPSQPARSVFGLDQVDEGRLDGRSDLAGAVVIANELLDNLPFRVVERGRSGWSELHVTTGADGRPREQLREADVSDPLVASVISSIAHEEISVGTRLPVLGAARDWVATILAQEVVRLVVFDYGAATSVELARRGGWLRTYRNHERGTDPLLEPGQWDITTDVAMDQLPPPDELITQAEFLRRWGIEQLVAEGRDHWHAHAAAPDLEAMRMRSRIREAEALVDPEGLGGWMVATWCLR